MGSPAGTRAPGMMPPITRRHKRNNPEYCEPAMTKYRQNLKTITILLATTVLFAGCASVKLLKSLPAKPTDKAHRLTC